MNKLSYRINKEDVLYHSVVDREGFEIVIDDMPTRYFFDIQEFEKSLGKDGFYGICVGPCMLSGCCGLYMEIAHKADKVIWKRFLENDGGFEGSIPMPDGNDAREVPDIYISKDKRVVAPLEFNKEGYEKLVKELKTRIK